MRRLTDNLSTLKRNSLAGASAILTQIRPSKSKNLVYPDTEPPLLIVQITFLIILSSTSKFNLGSLEIFRGDIIWRVC